MDETVADRMLVNYRCPCGCEFSVSANEGGQCPECERKVSAAALQELVYATVSFVEQNVDDTHLIEAEDDPWLGQQLEHFKIVERLGRGGMGSVYRALDCSLQRYVAVKLIRSSNGQAPERHKTQSLLQEAVAQARVHHPHVVTIYYVSHDPQNPFLAMELMNGTVASSLGQFPLPFSTVINIAIQVVEALRASYQLDIVHGDIKPSNLLVDRLGTVKLSDFGLARRIDSQKNEPLGLRGTPNYLSPEILKGGKPNVASDMFALGVTFYEMAYGRPPQILEGKSVANWIADREKLNLDPPKAGFQAIPRTWIPLLNRLLAANPEDRFESYDELLTALYKVRPSTEMTAGRLPRLVAWGFDQVIIATVAYGLAMVADQFSKSPPWTFWPLIFLMPAGIYLLICSRWTKTLGAYAMQLRQIDISGFTPTRRVWWLREMVRTVVFWLFVVCVSALGAGFSQQLIYIIAGVIWMVFFVDVAAILFPGAQCLHDRLLGTRVVLRRATE